MNGTKTIIHTELGGLPVAYSRPRPPQSDFLAPPSKAPHQENGCDSQHPVDSAVQGRVSQTGQTTVHRPN